MSKKDFVRIPVSRKEHALDDFLHCLTAAEHDDTLISPRARLRVHDRLSSRLDLFFELGFITAMEYSHYLDRVVCFFPEDYEEELYE